MNRVLVAILFLFLPASSLADDLFDIKPVADGIYAAIAKPAYKVNCNAAIIILDDAVLVVDTHSKPSAARVLIEQIKKLTPKPVKFVVNTHFHWDHYQGNEAYPSSWPAGVEIISSEATRTSIEQRGIPRVKHEIATMPAEIEQLKADLQKAPTLERRASTQKDISEAEAYLIELKSMQITLPTMTFDRSLMLHRKTRTVEILWLGRAHTDGDVFVYLPNEKVLVTGDALHGGPLTWATATHTIGSRLWMSRRSSTSTTPLAVTASHEGKTDVRALEAILRRSARPDRLRLRRWCNSGRTKKRVSDYLISKYASKFDPKFPQSMGTNVIKAYQVIAFAP